MKNKYMGSNFDDFLKEEGTLEETQAAATKKVIAYQILEIMKKRHLTKKRMTERMRMKLKALADHMKTKPPCW